VLLAPAVRFGDEHYLLTRDKSRVEDRGQYDFFHYALGGSAVLRLRVYEDSLSTDGLCTLFTSHI